jgi:hypothetical protein
MPESVPSCSTCNVTMEIGYTVIANYQIAPYTALRSLKWVAGEPVGVKLGIARPKRGTVADPYISLPELRLSGIVCARTCAVMLRSVKEA